MISGSQAFELYGPQTWQIRLKFRIQADGQFTNRDLLSIAHVVDWLTRLASSSAIAELEQDLAITPAQAAAMRERLSAFPRGAFETGEVVELSTGSINIDISIWDLALVQVALTLLRATLLRDVEVAWQETGFSERFQATLKQSLPRAMKTAANIVKDRVLRQGRLGSRLSVSNVDSHEDSPAKEIDVTIEAKKSSVVNGSDDWPDPVIDE